MQLTMEESIFLYDFDVNFQQEFKQNNQKVVECSDCYFNREVVELSIKLNSSCTKNLSIFQEKCLKTTQSQCLLIAVAASTRFLISSFKIANLSK